jgi:hypothetical protein
VILEPWTDDADYLTQCVAMMDVFVLNSLWEGSPLAIIEAMAMERPVVATDIPALREMVQEAGCGLLSSPGRPEQWRPTFCGCWIRRNWRTPWERMGGGRRLRDIHSTRLPNGTPSFISVWRPPWFTTDHTQAGKTAGLR